MSPERKTKCTLHHLIAMYRGNVPSTHSSAVLADEIGLIALSDTDERYEARDFLAHLLEDDDGCVHTTAYMRARYLACHARAGRKLQNAMLVYEQEPAHRVLVAKLDGLDRWFETIEKRLCDSASFTPH